MRPFRLALICIAVNILATCGGGGEGNGESIGVAAEATTKRSVQLFGDSTMDLAAPLIAAALTPHSVANKARSGTTSTMLLAGTDSVVKPTVQPANPPWPQSITAEVVLINHGMNDSQSTYGPPYGISIDSYKANLRTLVKRSPVPVILETPNPCWRADVNAAPYAQAMREVAAELGVPLIDVHASVLAQADWRGWIADGIHPSDAAVEKIVNGCIAPRLRALL